MTSRHRPRTTHAARRVVGIVAVLAAAVSAAGVSTAGASSPEGATAPSAASTAPYPCAPNGAPGGQTVYGSFGDASLIGWAGNHQGVVGCLGGSFFVITGNPPGSGTTDPVEGTTYGYGVYNDTRTRWHNARGYLPALVTSFRRQGTGVSITNFADRIVVGGHAYVAVYSRVRVHNPTATAVRVAPQPSAGLLVLHQAPVVVPAHRTVEHDYVVAVDRFGHKYAFPSAKALTSAGGFEAHFDHMRHYWNGQLAKIAQIRHLPDPKLVDAYRTGFIYTQIIRAGTHLKTGINGYDVEFSHDVIGILANLFDQGYFTRAHALLDRARRVIGEQSQYSDGVWTYAWPWAIYLQKTGDLAFVKSHFATEGPGGKKDPSIKDTAHAIAAQRTGPGGIMEQTSDIDADGYWTIDNYEALMGLAAYRYLARQVGNRHETTWATQQYRSLLTATDARLAKTIARYHLHSLPCSMVEPNSANRCANAQDANWAAPFLFGRWAWDGYLFGAKIHGPGKSLIDPTYRRGFARLKGKLPPNTFGGYPTNYFSTAYNAGYGEWGLASRHHRTQGIKSYRFMVANGQSGPYSWWESQQYPNRGVPWAGTHPASGNGSSPHAWGIANANLVLLHSLVAQRSNGTLIVGRGVPNGWLRPHRSIRLANVPTVDGRRLGFSITSTGKRVTLRLRGDAPAGRVLFQLPAFVANIAGASGGRIHQKSGTVSIPASAGSVTVTLKHSV